MHGGGVELNPSRREGVERATGTEQHAPVLLRYAGFVDGQTGSRLEHQNLRRNGEEGRQEEGREAHIGDYAPLRCVEARGHPFAAIISDMLAELLLKWPLIRQLRGGGDGTGVEAMSERTNALRPKNEGAAVARCLCPYCAVGCGQLIYHRDGRIVSIEGDPQSPISRGHLCPKGANSYELVTPAGRLTKVKYRAPRSKKCNG